MVEGLIDEIYPDGRFGVMLDNEHRIIAYTAGKMRRFRIKSVVGDRVQTDVEGGRRAGLPTVLVRPDPVPEGTAPRPDHVVPDLTGLLAPG